MPEKSTIEDMREIAKLRGGECLSRVYTDSRTKLRWRCSKGHAWRAVPHNVRRGDWCQQCHLEKLHSSRRLTVEEMRGLARMKGGECLSEEYSGIYVKQRWRCGKGHVWETSPASIKYGSWCPVCGGKRKLTIEEMRSIAVSRGGKCLSKKYVNSQTKLKWRCSKGHVWEAIPASVRQGRWCRRCAAKKREAGKRMAGMGSAVFEPTISAV